MIFINGYVHCDPHPGNVLVNKAEDGRVSIVLLDHGLYLVSFSLVDGLPYEILTVHIIYAEIAGLALECEFLQGIEKVSETECEG